MSIMQVCGFNYFIKGTVNIISSDPLKSFHVRFVSKLTEILQKGGGIKSITLRKI